MSTIRLFLRPTHSFYAVSELGMRTLIKWKEDRSPLSRNRAVALNVHQQMHGDSRWNDWVAEMCGRDRFMAKRDPRVDGLEGKWICKWKWNANQCKVVYPGVVQMFKSQIEMLIMYKSRSRCIKMYTGNYKILWKWESNHVNESHDW